MYLSVGKIFALVKVSNNVNNVEGQQFSKSIMETLKSVSLIHFRAMSALCILSKNQENPGSLIFSGVWKRDHRPKIR